MLRISVGLYGIYKNGVNAFEKRAKRFEETGQATAEYVVVLLMAATVAFLVTKMFAGKGGGGFSISSIVGPALNLLKSAGGKLAGFLG